MVEAHQCKASLHQRPLTEDFASSAEHIGKCVIDVNDERVPLPQQLYS